MTEQGADQTGRPASRPVPDGPALDHVVINVLRRMDEAAALFTALGFQLTPLGRHSLGSINHLMMTRGPYLELIGVPAEGLQRQDVLDSPFGLNGLVLASRDADRTFERLSAAGLNVGRPSAFSRPVTIDGRTQDARFRTVRLPVATFAASRVYHCEHLTPGLVWHEPWLDHPNGFSGIDALRIASPHPERDAGRYAAACGSPAEPWSGGWRVPLGDAHLDVVPGSEARFLSLGLRFADLAAIGARAAVLPAVRWVEAGPGEADLHLPSFDVRLRCGIAR